MDLSDIELVKTIARVGSLSEAAKTLNQSQPTLSRKLLRLEDTLQAKLFHRSSRGLQATEIADYIIAESGTLNNQLKAITRYVELATTLNVGDVRVGVGPIIEQILLPEILSRVLQTTGDVQVSVMTEDDRTLSKMFDASEVDVVIGPLDTAYEGRKDVVTLPMVSDQIVLVASPDHPVFEAKDLTAAAIAKHQIAHPRTQGSVRQMENGIRVRPANLLFDNYRLLKELSMELNLICAGPTSVFQREIEEGTLRIIDVDLEMRWESVLLVRSAVLATPLVQHLVSTAQAVANEFNKNDLGQSLYAGKGSV